MNIWRGTITPVALSAPSSLHNQRPICPKIYGAFLIQMGHFMNMVSPSMYSFTHWINTGLQATQRSYNTRYSFQFLASGFLQTFDKSFLKKSFPQDCRNPDASYWEEFSAIKMCLFIYSYICNYLLNNSSLCFIYIK